MPYTRPLILLFSPALIAFVWLIFASEVWSIGTDTPFSIWAWWDALDWWEDDWLVTLWIVIGAFIPTLFLVIFLFGLVQWWRTRGPRRRLTTQRGAIKTSPLPIQRGITDNHGHSEWRSMESARKRFPGPEFPHGGIAVGEAYRVDHDHAVRGIEFEPKDKSTWGMGGRADLLIDPCTKGARASHSAEFGASGVGKSAELVTKALTWTGSSLIFDPTSEMGPALDRAMRLVQRKRVYHVGLSNAASPLRKTGFNVLTATVDVTDPDVGLQIQSMVDRIYDDRAAAAAMKENGYSGDPFWGLMGRTLVSAILSHLVWSDPDKIEISLAAFAAGIMTPENDMISLLHKIHANSRSRAARRDAGALMQARALETFSAIYLNAVSAVRWLSEDRWADLLSVGDFDPHSLLNGNCTVFVDVDLRSLQIARTVPRVIIGAILDVIVGSRGHVHSPIAVLVDEADTLRNLDVLRTIRDQGRHLGVVFHGLWQSPYQLRSTWGDAEYRAWMDAFSWMGFRGVRALGFGKELSESLGGYGVMAFSEGNNQGQNMPLGLAFGTFSRGQNVNVHEIAHRLTTASEIQQDYRSDEKVIVCDTGMPIRCGAALGFRRPEIVKLLST